MNLLSRWFGRQYQDEQIVGYAQNAIAEDPLVNDTNAVTIVSTKGVVRITGTVHRLQEKERIEGVVQRALSTTGLKYERLINELAVS